MRVQPLCCLMVYTDPGIHSILFFIPLAAFELIDSFPIFPFFFNFLITKVIYWLSIFLVAITEMLTCVQTHSKGNKSSSAVLVGNWQVHFSKLYFSKNLLTY